MSVSYKKLGQLLIDRDMKKKDLCEAAGISTASVTKMGKGGHVTTEVLAKVCVALNCTMDKAQKKIRVKFGVGEKLFVYPDAFIQGHLKVD